MSHQGLHNVLKLSVSLALEKQSVPAANTEQGADEFTRCKQSL